MPLPNAHFSGKFHCNTKRNQPIHIPESAIWLINRDHLYLQTAKARFSQKIFGRLWSPNLTSPAGSYHHFAPKLIYPFFKTVRWSQGFFNHINIKSPYTTILPQTCFSSKPAHDNAGVSIVVFILGRLWSRPQIKRDSKTFPASLLTLGHKPS